MTLRAAVKFPETAEERDRWILSRRPARNAVNAYEPYAFFTEEECGPSGNADPVATIFLTNRECPFRCTMCDLWRNTLLAPVPSGAIPAQLDFAFRRLPDARTVKLYNSGSFFDPRAIPQEDYVEIAARLQRLERVIVECHPAFVGDACTRLRDLLPGRLEVAMGLETAHPAVLQKLNKRMTLEQFAAAAEFLRKNDIDLRVFILVQPPFLAVSEALEWAMRSLDFARDCGATAATLIPTRGGNGAMEELSQAGVFTPPSLGVLERAFEHGLRQRGMRVFADLWELPDRGACEQCFPQRVSRLRAMNLRQQPLPPIVCDFCQQAGSGT